MDVVHRRGSPPGTVKRPLMRPTAASTGLARLAVLADVAAARDGDLHEHDAAAQVAALLEQELERAQPLPMPFV